MTIVKWGISGQGYYYKQLTRLSRFVLFNPILDGVRAYPILDGGQKSPPGLTLPFSV